MKKLLDLRKTVYELVTEYPEVADIMSALGFTEIKKKAILHSVGKLTTIPKGAKMKSIPIESIILEFESKGFEVVGHDVCTHSCGQPTVQPAASDVRIEQLKTYLRRLNEGESLDNVRKDFVEQFGDVGASEIMRAEQELLKEGTPLHEVQKLCDVHSALFHSSVSHEHGGDKDEEGETFNLIGKTDSTDNHKLSEMVSLKGHVLYTFTKENEAIVNEINAIKRAVALQEDVTDRLIRLREAGVHYAKKGDLIYPLLKVKYGISGPSNVMWTVDDEIRAEISSLLKAETGQESRKERLSALLNRMEEMTYKEANILFPICVEHFTDDEWQAIYRDSKAYPVCLSVENEAWEGVEPVMTPRQEYSNDKVFMPGGSLTVEQLTALLNTIPMEITFVDAENINRFFNEGHKVFKRPTMALNRDVFSCHPPKVETIVRKIIDDFRSGKQSSVPIWMEKEGRAMFVHYMAMRDGNNKYLGTVELVQDMEFARNYFTSK